MTEPPPIPVPRWLRVWAVLTALSAVPLIILGAEVTTKNVGMVDKVGFRAPWFLFTTSLPPEAWLGYVIEHGHRLAGFVVGFFCIVLAVGLLLQGRGWLYRSLGLVALAAVGAQGVLGIYRVNHDVLYGPELRTVHGCFAQLVFATLVSVAVMTSRVWWDAPPAERGKLGKSAVGLCVLIYLQIVFGAIMRHTLDPVAQRVHILLAFAVVVKVFWMFGKLRSGPSDRATTVFAWVLLLLVLVQPVFGVEAWVRRFGSGEWAGAVHSSLGLDLARSGHHVIGTLIFSAAAALATLLHRPAPKAASAPVLAPRAVEGAA